MSIKQRKKKLKFIKKKAPSWELRCFPKLRKLKCITKTEYNTIVMLFLFKENEFFFLIK